MRLLLDEHLSPRLAQRCASLDVAAAHVAHLGKAGWSDARLLRFATVDDWVFVTANAGDFINLASRTEMHCGLIVLRAQSLSFEEQWIWLRAALRYVSVRHGGLGGLVNRLIEVRSPDDISSRGLPPEI